MACCSDPDIGIVNQVGSSPDTDPVRVLVVMGMISKELMPVKLIVVVETTCVPATFK